MMRATRNEKRMGMPTHFQGMGFRGRRALPLAGILVAAAFICGCGGVVSGKNTSTTTPTPTTQTYSISGTITPSSGGSGATIALSGVATGTTTGDTSGNYSFGGLANGTYTVSPSHAGYTFSPTSQNATVNGANVSGMNFTATPQQAHSATLSWVQSTSAVSGYNVYRGTVSGGPYTLVNGSLVTPLTFTDSAVQSGLTYFYVTTAVDGSGNESVFSNEVKAVIP
jgi:hypothetical protein